MSKTEWRMEKRKRSPLPKGETMATVSVKVHQFLEANWKDICLENNGWSRKRCAAEISKHYGWPNFTTAMLRYQLKAWPHDWPKITYKHEKKVKASQKDLPYQLARSEALEIAIDASIARDLTLAKVLREIIQELSLRKEIYLEHSVVSSLLSLIERLELSRVRKWESNA